MKSLTALDACMAKAVVNYGRIRASGDCFYRIRTTIKVISSRRTRILTFLGSSDKQNLYQLLALCFTEGYFLQRLLAIAAAR